jgi:hypothetical protein
VHDEQQNGMVIIPANHECIDSQKKINNAPVSTIHCFGFSFPVPEGNVYLMTRTSGPPGSN